MEGSKEVIDTPECDALIKDPHNRTDIRAWVNLAHRLERQRHDDSKLIDFLESQALRGVHLEYFVQTSESMPKPQCVAKLYIGDESHGSTNGIRGVISGAMVIFNTLNKVAT